MPTERKRQAPRPGRRKTRAAPVPLPPGVLVLDKPAGCTSHDLVDFVRLLVGRKSKVGHTGTLDPAATGVLPLCLGKATRLAGFLTSARKAYLLEARLDLRTDTGDMDGEITWRLSGDGPRAHATAACLCARSALEAAAAGMTGEIEQVPPMYSAVRVGGKRLYELARKGRTVERPARRVTVYEFSILDFRPPFFTARVECSSGTYVRTLVEDLGRSLGLGGVLVSLRREAAGPFTLDRACTVFELAGAYVRDGIEGIAGMFVPWEQVFPGLPMASVRDEFIERVRNGAPLTEEHIKSIRSGEGRSVILLGGDGGIVAVYRRDGRMGCLRAEKVVI